MLKSLMISTFYYSWMMERKLTNAKTWFNNKTKWFFTNGNKKLITQDSWLIEFSDNETKIVTTDELLEMERNAEKFDGFYSWKIVKKIQ